MEPLVNFNEIPQFYKTEIEGEYNRLMRLHFNDGMLRFINAKMHKEEFIRGVYTVLDDILHGDLDVDNEDHLNEDVMAKVAFFFNHFEGETVYMADQEIVDFVRMLVEHANKIDFARMIVADAHAEEQNEQEADEEYAWRGRRGGGRVLGAGLAGLAVGAGLAGGYAYPYYEPGWAGAPGYYGGYYYDNGGWWDRPGGRHLGRGHPGRFERGGRHGGRRW